MEFWYTQIAKVAKAEKEKPTFIRYHGAPATYLCKMATPAKKRLLLPSPCEATGKHRAGRILAGKGEREIT